MLKKYTNYGGETIEVNAERTVYFGKSKVHIEGIDEADCNETIQRRFTEFSQLEHNVDMYTPKLCEYLQQRRQIRI